MVVHSPILLVLSLGNFDLGSVHFLKENASFDTCTLQLFDFLNCHYFLVFILYKLLLTIQSNLSVFSTHSLLFKYLIQFFSVLFGLVRLLELCLCIFSGLSKVSLCLIVINLKFYLLFLCLLITNFIF